MNKLNRLPVTFTKTGEVDGKDIRFISVTIDVLHTGENRNGSVFDKETVDAAAESIKNTPILGYIEKDRAGEIDFKGHEHKLVMDDEGIKYVYAGSAYGVIPESCNPRWVTKQDDKGIEREYFCVDGLLWTKFDDACDIFRRDSKKNHSMEITQIKGYVNEAGHYTVTSFLFDGCCILSTTDPKIRPAMDGSEIAVNFSADTIAGQVKKMLDEYTALKSSQSSKEAEIKNFAKGEDSLDKKEEILASYGIDKTSLDFSLEEISMEELEEKCKEMAAKADPDAGKNGAQFALNMKDLWCEIEAAVSSVETTTDEWGYKSPRYWLQDVQDDLAIVVDGNDWKLYAFPYTMDGDNVVVDFADKKRCKVKYELWEDGAEGDPDAGVHIQNIVSEYEGKVKADHEKLYIVQADYDKVKAEFDAMKPKYDAYAAAEAEAVQKENEEKREQLFQIMDKQLGDTAEYAALKENKDMEFSVLEGECYKLLGKKAAEFSYVPSEGKKEEGKDFARFGVSGVQVKSKSDSRYGDLFERYGVR